MPRRYIALLVSLLFFSLYVLHNLSLRVVFIESLANSKDSIFAKRAKDIIDQLNEIESNLAMAKLKTRRIDKMYIRLIQLESEVQNLRANALLKDQQYSGQVLVFKSTQTAQAVADSFITTYPGQENYNAGEYPAIPLGFGSKDKVVIRRGLIKFPEIQTRIPRGALIKSAKVFLKQDRESQDGNGNADEIVELYEILKDWNEGVHLASPATPGECSWNNAQSGVVPWSTPGLWSDDKDINRTVLALATGINAADSGAWAILDFNSYGIKRLQAMIDGGPNYGWLIKQANEEDATSRLRFYSSDTEYATDFPYIEITYILP